MNVTVESYCHESQEGFQVSRDEVLRLQQMSRRLPFDDVMANVGAFQRWIESRMGATEGRRKSFQE